MHTKEMIQLTHHRADLFEALVFSLTAEFLPGLDEICVTLNSYSCLLTASACASCLLVSASSESRSE